MSPSSLRSTAVALTIFAHAETGDDLADHTEHVIWFGPSEPLDLSIFS